MPKLFALQRGSSGSSNETSVQTYMVECVNVFLPVLHKLVEVLLHVLKDKVQVIVLSDDLLQLHHIRMVQLL